MIISAILIKNSRMIRYCEHCNKRIEGETLRLYGAGLNGDPPYVIYLHPNCTESTDPKITKIMNKYRDFGILKTTNQ
jgi:hypothetical protein